MQKNINKLTFEVRIAVAPRSVSPLEIDDLLRKAVDLAQQPCFIFFSRRLLFHELIYGFFLELYLREGDHTAVAEKAVMAKRCDTLRERHGGVQSWARGFQNRGIDYDTSVAPSEQ